MTFLAPRFLQSRREAILLETRDAMKAAAAEARVQTQMLYDALTPEEKERVVVARVERQRARLKQQRAGFKRGFMMILLTIIIFAFIYLVVHARAHAQSHQTPIYGADASNQGSVYDYGKTQTYTDRNGHFSGSAVNNGNGTTSFYNRNGNFTGSAGSSIDRAFNFNRR